MLIYVIHLTDIFYLQMFHVKKAWSPAHRGSTASATAVASAARVVNGPVQPKVQR